MPITSYIIDNAVILIPALYVVGEIIKKTEVICNKYIPAILLPLGILGSVGIMGLSANSVIQGVLVTGATVLSDQLVKQSRKKE